jgi:hypothetical protein
MSNKAPYPPEHLAVYDATIRKRDQLLIDFKRQPCADCGEYFLPCAMDIHHQYPERKHPKLQRHRNSWKSLSLYELEQELAHCLALCACCHRVRHWHEQQAKQSVAVSSRRKSA